MDITNPLYAITVFLIAYITSKTINIKYKINLSASRNISIDGFRGFLAIGVFIHHSAIWYNYIHTGDWSEPNSNLYNQLGSACVSFFFMITSYLFINKLLNTKGSFDWYGYFISRFFRLTPAYYFSFILILIVIIIIDKEINVGIIKFLTSLIHWLLYTTFNNPIINSNIYTKIINGGVLWSLRYEWFFYFILPFVSIPILKKLPPFSILVFSSIFILIFFQYRTFEYSHLFSFLGGAVTPFLIRNYKNKKFDTNFYSIAVLLCLISILLFHSSENFIGKIILIIAFNIIALGNTIFGLLKKSPLLLLGEICYSTYLLHGIILFILFHIIIKQKNIINLSQIEYWLIIALLTPIVVFISYISFIYIENPGMKISRKITEKLRTISKKKLN